MKKVETLLPIIDVPKSKEIFTGDINMAVIKVQEITGFEITPDWWLTNVGNEGTTESILDRFDAAFSEYVHNKDKTAVPAVESLSSPNKWSLAADEASESLADFNAKFGDDPGIAPLRAEFLDALDEHLTKKYFLEEAEGAHKLDDAVQHGNEGLVSESQAYDEYEERRQQVFQQVSAGELSAGDSSLRELDPEVYIGRQELLERYKDFDLDGSLCTQLDHIASGLDADVYAYNQDGKEYVVRAIKKKVLAASPAKTDDYTAALLHGQGVKGLEQIVAVSYEDGVVVSERAPGNSLKDLLNSRPEVINNIPDEHLTQLLALFEQMQEKGLVADVNHGNLIYDEEQGFTLVDYMYCPPEYWGVRGQSLDIKVKALKEMADRHFPGLGERLSQSEGVE